MPLSSSSPNCLLLFLLLLKTIGAVVGREWLVATMPMDDRQQLKRAMEEILERLQPELNNNNSVFDLTTITPSSSMTAKATTASISTGTQRPSRRHRNNLHPFMTMLYKEIEENKNERWAEMDSPDATIRGIEPAHILSVVANRSVSLTFKIGTIKDVSFIHHVDLVLTSSRGSHLDMEGVKYLEVDISTTNGSAPTVKLETFVKVSNDDGHQTSFLVLEMTPTIREWWSKGHMNAIQTVRLSSPSSSIDLTLKRPLLVFYYGTNRDGTSLEGQSRSRRSTGRAFGQAKPQPKPQSNLCPNCGAGKVVEPKNNPTNTVKNNSVTVYGGSTIKNVIVKNNLTVKNVSTENNVTSDTLCKIHSWSVTMDELKWSDHVVIHPLKLEMDYCSGSCSVPHLGSTTNSTYHAIVRGLFLMTPNNGTTGIPPPYCVPTALGSHSVIMLDKNNHMVFSRLHNVIAMACGCR